MLERNVEKFTIEGNKPINDWIVCNNERKEVNINFYQKKKEQNLSQERIQPFDIIGKENNWNYTTSKENEIKLTIIGVGKKNNNENKEVVIINNDYNIIEDNQIKQIQKKFTKNLDSSDESGNLEIQNGQINEYKDLIQNQDNNNQE